jgi:hypothetical protein
MNQLLVSLFIFLSLNLFSQFDINKDTFYVRGYGNVDNSDLIDVKNIIKTKLGFNCIILSNITLDSSMIIKGSPGILEANLTLKSLKVLQKTIYVTEHRLWYNRDYLRGLSFLNGNVAIIRGDKSFLEETTIHEIGHLFGLDHCSDITCIMALNNDEFDSGHFCNSCRVHYNQKLNNNCITSK